jgi:CDGSH-type Zn-finger protein
MSGTNIVPMLHLQEMLCLQKSEELWFCGCKATGEKPFCVGTRESL